MSSNKKKALTTLIFSAILLLSSCIKLDVVEPASYDYSLLYNLTVNDTLQQLYIFKTEPYENYTYINLGPGIKFGPLDNQAFIRFIENAEVNVEGNNGTDYSYTYVYDSLEYITKYYSIDQHNYLSKNSTYELKCKINDQFISGSTTTPGDFNIVFPPNHKRIDLNDYKENVGIMWGESNKAFGYCVKIKTYWTTFYDGEEMSRTNKYEYFTEKNSVDVEASFLMGDKAIIEIRAIDENIYNHIVKEVNQSGLEGAYGVFGSSVMKSVEVYPRW